MLFTVEAWEKAVPESCKGVKATGEQPCLKVSYQRATRMLLMSVRLRCAISILIETDDWICSAFLRHECPKNEQPQVYCYLVDPASSHMLVSKIKPCMSKYECLYTVKLRMAH